MEDGDTENQANDKPEQKGDAPTEDAKEDISELDKLKTNNKELEDELIKGRKLKAEIQELEAEKMRGGKSEAGQPTEEKKESNADYVKRVQQGEFNGPKEA